MKLGTFVFPTASEPARDAAVIDDALEEARLSEALGMDAIWLAEHHFDGMCAYADPVVFAAALAAATERAKIGFAVVQASLHHPLRLAEQISLLDHLTKGRLLAGLGRGSMFHDYEYEGFGIDPEESAARLDEIEEVIRKCWQGGPVVHHGRFWDFDIPGLRPAPFTTPHPVLMRAVGSEGSIRQHAQSGSPFMLAGPKHIVLQRVEMIRTALRETGRDEAEIARILEDSWVWQHVVVADTDAEAHEIGMKAVEDYAINRERIGRESSIIGMLRGALEKGTPPGGYVLGTAETVAENLMDFGRAGLGGLIIRFDIGPMPAALSQASLRAFMDGAAPKLRAVAPELAAAR